MHTHTYNGGGGAEKMYWIEPSPNTSAFMEITSANAIVFEAAVCFKA